MQPHTKRTRTSAKQIDQIDPITSIQIEERRGLSFEGELIVIAVTVVLAEFGKAFVGQFAKTIVESIVKKVQRIRAGSSVEVVYQGSLTPRLKAELTIRYRSAKALKKDKDQHPYYLAMAAGYLAARSPRNDEIVSLTEILRTDSPDGPESILLQLAAS